MKNKELKVLDDGLWIDVIDRRPDCLTRIFKIFAEFEDACDFGVSGKYMGIAKEVANIYSNSEISLGENYFKSKVKLVSV